MKIPRREKTRSRVDHGTWYEVERTTIYVTPYGIQVMYVEWMTASKEPEPQPGRMDGYWKERRSFHRRWRGRVGEGRKWEGEFNSLREVYKHFGICRYRKM